MNNKQTKPTYINHPINNNTLVQINGFHLSPAIYQALAHESRSLNTSLNSLLAHVIRPHVVKSNPEKYGEYKPTFIEDSKKASGEWVEDFGDNFNRGNRHE